MASFLLLISGIFLVVSLSIPLVREKPLTSEPSGHEDYSDDEGDDDSKSNDRWIQVVSRCPPEWTNQTVQRLCQEEAVQNGPVLELPVQNDQGITFANHFCAACHGVSKLLEWKVGWTCDDTRVFAASVGGYFSSGAVSEGFFLGLQQDQSCKMTVTPPIANTIESCSAPHFRHGPSIPINNMPGTNYPVSFNVLMNFDFAGKTHILFVAEYEEETEAGPRCERDEAYDPFQNECRQVFCAPGQRLGSTGCVPEQNVHASSPIHRETQGDLSQLADSRDIQRVHMEVNIPASDLLLFNISGYNDYLQEQIAAQLNISRYRIKNFEVSFHQGNSSSNSVVIQTMSKEECREEALECDDNEGSSNPTRDDLRTTSSESPTVSGSMTRPDSVTMPTKRRQRWRGQRLAPHKYIV
ncbi:hypothetical protein C0Q70_03935 [Pomacea canaliculata]|uniref:CUB domain-containing protein n=1 Tax=Pomacea canaliculata TaxID=400727 RepID=A0A2T7PU44_POMCA|nr:hypothetical protein C0Q70_03935 [Pomacea canaliculata]